MRVLVTGGLGFIGSNLVRALCARGDCDVTVIDNLSAQVHAGDTPIAQQLRLIGARVHISDVRHIKNKPEILNSPDVVVHLAAETGTAQSMYEIEKYVDVNARGTAVLLDALLDSRHRPSKIILASSRSVYGEGARGCLQHGVVYPRARNDRELLQRLWEPLCPVCKLPTQPVATSELAPISCASIYAHSKLAQEELIRIACASGQISFVALRFQNVYGPGQSLRNPYTGILSIFSNRIRQGLDLPIFEDGGMGRDFVFISDVVKSLELAIDAPILPHQIYNVGSGELVTISKITTTLMKHFEKDVNMILTGECRAGDIRTCYADMTRANLELGFCPTVRLSDGLAKFADWVNTQPIFEDRLADANRELKSKNLMK